MLRPIGDRILVEVIEVENKTTGGIILSGQAQEKPTQGKVLAAGKGKKVEGVYIPMDVAEGDTVIFSKYAGTPVKFEDKEYLILKEDDVLAIVE